MGKRAARPWLEEPESHPRDPVLRNQSLYSFQHINGFNFSLPLSAYNLFDGAPIWKLRASSGMHASRVHLSLWVGACPSQREQFISKAQ